MIIKATDFQQNVGYYLALAESGRTVTIERVKPVRSRFKLTKDTSFKVAPSSKTNAKLRELKKHIVKSLPESGLDLQARVRE